MAEAWRVSLHPGRFRSDEARMRCWDGPLAFSANWEVAVRRELGAGPPQVIAEVVRPRATVIHR